MRARRTLFLAGAAVAVAAVIGAGTQATAGPVDVRSAGVAADQLTDHDLRSALTPMTDIAPGTTMTQQTIAEAIEQLQMPKNLVITPAVCTYLVDLGGLDGWTQTGVTPDGHFQQSLFGVQPGGLDLDKIRANAESCTNGTISVPEAGLTGTITLTEFAVPKVDGIDAVGIKQVVSFGGDKSDTAVQLEKMSSTQLYLTAGDLGGIICEELPVRTDFAQAMQERMKALVG